MTRRTFALILIASAALCGQARAALYEFTLGGRVTYAPLGDVPIGTAVTIRYTADSQDLDPSPTDGLYAASQATVQFPTFTIQTDGMMGPDFGVSLGNGTSVQILQYLTWQNSSWGMSIPFSFPTKTLNSDALPLTLPLTDANLARFHLFPLLHDLYAGDITSYTAVEVPEPAALVILLVGSLGMRLRSCAPLPLQT
jgi:hypothetical protein